MALGRLLHWGPLTALTIIFTLFIASVYSSLVWWSPLNVAGLINIALLVVFLVCILYNFIKASRIGPGYVPLRWKPEKTTDEKFMQFCQICEGYKAPRSHHCRQCNRCVMKMDHHCPWINNCVGHKNHKRFTLFLFFVVIGCSYAAVPLIGCIYYVFTMVNPMAYRRFLYAQLVPFEFYHLLGIVFCIGLDIGVTIAVALLLFYQIKDIVRNESAIEAWIVEKAAHRSKNDVKFIYPYNLGRWENIKQVLHFNGDYIGDGIHWPVVESCNQYSLTVEQLRQKQVKRHYSVEFKSTVTFNGSFCGWRNGLKTCLTFPCSVEGRLRFEKDEILVVTRWRKHWLYAMKVENEKKNLAKDPQKGWFPRNCAIRLDDHDGDITNQDKSKDE
ncbi:palmitoyltransferase ZDHHC6-like [Xenia sp. Carnegie-2017]|uniref:palmitoyltransferase ZDHHC6-like n=1 Tax=Xenia sp. Carnegie-2017 TaxID=2897299 RepID=UPI001F0362CC|nr:palmitoyltransferase ZDHHC6-like [Xenia sp. Carnegie-2017]